ncbi:MAG TPA: hypothetical protein VI790_01705 [Candidatus Nanoarchaeia archaeon]|nr:hypothetical protein [Candidatus Nanoarchaeia archaeon]
MATTLYNVIRYNIPYKTQQIIRKAIPIDETLYMNLLLAEPVKTFEKGKPVFTCKHEKLLKEKIKNVKEMQKEYAKYIKDLLKKGIEEYKKGKIKPYFLE